MPKQKGIVKRQKMFRAIKKRELWRAIIIYFQKRIKRDFYLFSYEGLCVCLRVYVFVSVCGSICVLYCVYLRVYMCVSSFLCVCICFSCIFVYACVSFFCVCMCNFVYVFPANVCLDVCKAVSYGHVFVFVCVRLCMSF